MRDDAGVALAPDPPATEAVKPLPEVVFARVFRRLGLKRPTPEFQVQFRSFAGLRTTIRLRDNRIAVRISDVLESAPPVVLEALAEIMLGRVFRRRASREARECFLAYIDRPEMRRHIDEVRRLRGFKRLLRPRGRCYDLEEIFAGLNRRFFQNQLTTPRLGWSLGKPRTLLGHYDSAHGTITVSRWFDSPFVPRYVVEYLVFHEMLHMRYVTERRGHRRVIHSREFREAEKRFPKYRQALRRLRLLSS